MSSTPATFVRGMLRNRVLRRCPAPPSRIGRGPHGISTVAVVRKLLRTLRTRAGSGRR